MIKELEADIEVLKMGFEDEEQTGIFDVKDERVKTKSSEARVM